MQQTKGNDQDRKRGMDQGKLGRLGGKSSSGEQSRGSGIGTPSRMGRHSKSQTERQTESQKGASQFDESSVAEIQEEDDVGVGANRE